MRFPVAGDYRFISLSDIPRCILLTPVDALLGILSNFFSHSIIREDSSHLLRICLLILFCQERVVAILCSF